MEILPANNSFFSKALRSKCIFSEVANFLSLEDFPAVTTVNHAFRKAVHETHLDIWHNITFVLRTQPKSMQLLKWYAKNLLHSKIPARSIHISVSHLDVKAGPQYEKINAVLTTLFDSLSAKNGSIKSIFLNLSISSPTYNFNGRIIELLDRLFAQMGENSNNLQKLQINGMKDLYIRNLSKLTSLKDVSFYFSADLPRCDYLLQLSGPLEKLRIASGHISSSVFLELAKKHKSTLTHLYIDNTFRFGEKFYQGLMMLRNLKQIKVANGALAFRNIPDRVIEELAKYHNETLESIEFHYLFKTQQETFQKFLSTNYPKIKDLKITSSYNINDAFLRSFIVLHSKTLETISISAGVDSNSEKHSQLSDKITEAIFTNCRKLIYLYIRGENLFTERVLDVAANLKVQESCFQSLKTFKCYQAPRYCTPTIIAKTTKMSNRFPLVNFECIKGCFDICAEY